MKRSLNLSRPPGPLLQKIENNIDLASCSYLNLLSKRFLNTLMRFLIKTTSTRNPTSRGYFYWPYCPSLVFHTLAVQRLLLRRFIPKRIFQTPAANFDDFFGQDWHFLSQQLFFFSPSQDFVVKKKGQYGFWKWRQSVLAANCNKTCNSVAVFRSLER